MKPLYDTDVWSTVDAEDLWIFDKLILSRRLKYVCGPTGVTVPRPGRYIVRPCVNLMGMSLGAKIVHLEKSTDHLPAGYFWQEIFEGRHLSIDFKWNKMIRCTEGFVNKNNISRFDRWIVTDDYPRLPAIVHRLVTKYEYANVEMIGGKVIEVHLRGNPDFDDGAVEVIPVWNDESPEVDDRFVYVPDEDGDRLGFYKRY